MEYCSTLLRQFRNDPTLVPPLNIIGHLMHKPKSWKEAYIMAEINFRCVVMSQDELLLFEWHLVYDGWMMGLRIFDRSDMHNLGICEYMCHSEAKWGGVLKGQQLIFAGMSLFMERDPSSWGWIIGKGKRSEYHSIEQESLEILSVRVKQCCLLFVLVVTAPLSKNVGRFISEDVDRLPIFLSYSNCYFTYTEHPHITNTSKMTRIFRRPQLLRPLSPPSHR